MKENNNIKKLNNNDYNKITEKIFNENKNLIEENKKLKKEIEDLKLYIDDFNKIKEDNNKKIFELSNQITELKKQIDLLTKKSKLNEEIFKNKSLILADKYENKINKLLNINIKSSNNFLFIINNHQIKNILPFLSYKDIINLRLVNKKINNEFLNSQSNLKNFFINIIKLKNKKFSELKIYDIKKEYLIKNPKLEYLINEYVLNNNKNIGKELKDNISQCLNFINKEVKPLLGLKPSLKQNNNNNNNNNNSNNISSIYNNYLFGGIKSMFGYNNNNNTNNNKINNPNEIINNKEIYDNLEQNDNKILEILNDNNLGIICDYEFDFNNSQEIKNYLNKFLRSNIDEQKITNFILELCNGYSNLLFNSKKLLEEIKELNIVKNCLNERYKFYSNLSNVYEKKIKNFNLNNNNNNNNINNNNTIFNDNKSINSKSSSFITNKENYYNSIEMKMDLFKKEDINVEELKKKLENEKMNLIISTKQTDYYREKYEECQTDYNQFRMIYLEENRNLKKKLNELIIEKENLNKK